MGPWWETLILGRQEWSAAGLTCALTEHDDGRHQKLLAALIVPIKRYLENCRSSHYCVIIASYDDE